MSKLFAWALGIAIVIVANLFFNYAIALVYSEPMYETYCPVQQVQAAAYPDQKVTDYYAACQKDFNTAQSIYNRNVFVILVILGIATVAVAAFIKNEILSAGFSWAGVLALVIAAVRYWSNANNVFKVIILALALGLLVWIAVKKFSIDKKA
ncbi:MAG: protein of unknown function with transrane region [Patescibacteria group bacterium]|nr:protein of unknown function with transrane region [Patescibacteria group bacterium]